MAAAGCLCKQLTVCPLPYALLAMERPKASATSLCISPEPLSLTHGGGSGSTCWVSRNKHGQCQGAWWAEADCAGTRPRRRPEPSAHAFHTQDPEEIRFSLNSHRPLFSFIFPVIRAGGGVASLFSLLSSPEGPPRRHQALSECLPNE